MMAVKHRYGRFGWQQCAEHPTCGWVIIGPDNIVVAWRDTLTEASRYAIGAEALLQHYLDGRPGVYDPEKQVERLSAVTYATK